MALALDALRRAEAVAEEDIFTALVPREQIARRAEATLNLPPCGASYEKGDEDQDPQCEPAGSPGSLTRRPSGGWRR